MLINSPYLPATKSAGGLTFAKWKGLNTARGRIFVNKSKSPKQLFYRDKFKVTTDFLKSLPKAFYEPMWSLLEKNTTYINERNRANLLRQPDFVDEETPFSLDPSQILLSTGDREPVASPLDTTYNATTGLYEWTWGTGISGNGKPTDPCIACMISTENGIGYFTDGANREDGGNSITIPTGLNPIEMYAYVFVLVITPAGVVIPSLSKFTNT